MRADSLATCMTFLNFRSCSHPAYPLVGLEDLRGNTGDDISPHGRLDINVRAGEHQLSEQLVAAGDHDPVVRRIARCNTMNKYQLWHLSSPDFNLLKAYRFRNADLSSHPRAVFTIITV